MSRRKNTVSTSWAGRFAKEASNDRFVREIESYDRDLQREIQESADRSARIDYNIELQLEDRRWRERDPEGYAYEKEQQALEKEHTTKNYWKNWWAKLGRDMNDFLIGEFQGYIDRSNKWEELANSTMSYIEAQQELENVNQRLTQIIEAQDPLLSEEASKLYSRKIQLQDTIQSLGKDVEAFKSYIPSGVKSRYYDLVAGNSKDGVFSNNFIFGHTGAVHDEMGDILRFTSTMFNKNRSLSEQKLMLQKALDEKLRKVKEWQEGVDNNIKDRESYAKVDRWFQNKADAAGTDFFDSNTWKYGMPGLIAGSASGGSKILPAMLLGTATAVASVATGGIGGAAIFAAGGAGTLGLKYGAGVAENNAEVALAYNERLEDYLKNEDGKDGSLYDDIVKEGRRKLGLDKSVSDEQVFEQFRKGLYTVNNAAANKKMAKLATGIESQFQDELFATTGSAILETALEITPIGAFGKALKIPRWAKYAMLKNASRREALRAGKLGTIASGLTKGYEIGAVVSPITGAAYAPIHAAVSPILKNAGKATRGLFNDIAMTSHIAEHIPERALRKHFANSTKAKYLKGIAGNIMLTAPAEGIEEYKQYVAAERYKAGGYDDKIKSYGDTILDDFLAGIKGAGLILGMPFEGLMSESDRRALQEIKGGMIMGWLQTGIVNTASSIAPYRKELKATTAILNSVLLDKASKIDAFNKAQVYAEMAKSSSAYTNMVDGFNRLRKANQDEFDRSGEYGIDPKHVEEEFKSFQDVAKMSLDGYTIKQAETQGIEKDSKEYNKFVATKAVAMNEVEEAKKVSEMASTNRTDIENGIIENILTQRLQSLSEQPEDEEVTDKEGETTPIAQYSFDLDYGRTQNVALYSALLKRKTHLELGIQNAEVGGHDNIKKILESQLTEVEDRINNLKPTIDSYKNGNETIDIDNLESVEKNLVLDKLIHDDLSEAYRQEIAATQDYNRAIELYEEVVGKAYIDDKEVDYNNVKWDEVFDKVTFKGGNAKGVMQQIQETIDDDNDLASTIDEDFENRTDDEGNEVISEDEADNIETEVPPVDPNEELRKDTEENAPETETAAPPVVPPTTPPTTTVAPAAPEPEKPAEPILSPVEPVSPAQPTVVPETPLNAPEELKTVLEGDTVGASPIALDYLLTGGPGTILSTGYLLHGIAAAFPAISDQIENIRNLNLDQIDPNPETFKNDTTGVLNQIKTLVQNKYGSKGIAILDTILQNSTGFYSKDGLQLERQIDNLLPIIPKAQQDVLNTLKKKAEESSKYVKEVTSDYYLIDVNGTEIKMNRVHSIMPKYWAGDGSYKAALLMGNVFDNLARIFLGNKALIRRYETDKAYVINKLLSTTASHTDNPNDPGRGRTFNYFYNSVAEFEKTVEDLYILAKQYERNGWELSTEPIVWYSKFAVGWIAGETDMIAVDRQGNIHIIDFKTAKAYGNENPFGRYETSYTFSLPQNLEEQRLSLTQEDFTQGRAKKALSLNAKSFVRNLRNYLNNRNIRVVWENGDAVIKYVGSKYLETGKFRISHTYNGKTKGSKQDEYSDQLTAYQELVQKLLGNVVDLEVVGFRVSYNTDSDTNLISINSVRNSINDMPFRVKVSFSDEMHGILNNEGDPVEPVIETKTEQEEVQEANETNDAVKNQELEKQDNASFENKQEQPILPTIQEVEQMQVVGYSNLNANTLDKELTKSIVFDSKFVEDVISKGAIELYTENLPYRDNAIGKTVTKPALYANITYNGKTYKRIYVYATPSLMLKVQAFEKIKKDGQRIIAINVTRTEGEIDKGEKKSVLSAGLLNQELKDLKFDSSVKLFGFVKDGKTFAFVGGNVRMQDPIYTFTTNIPANGTIVYMKTFPRSKSEGGDVVKPIAINKKTLAGDADFIIDCLKNIDLLDKPYIIKYLGKELSVGITRRELLSMLIPFADDWTKVDKTFSIIRNPQVPSQFGIINKNKLNIATVDLRSAASINKFKDDLKNIDVVESPSLLVSLMGAPTADQAFVKIKKFFATNKDGVKSINISDTLKFDFDDFKGNGISGLAWYVKNGIFVTDYNGMKKPLVSVNDVAIYTEPPITPVPEATTPNEPILPQIDPADIDAFGVVNWGAEKCKTDKDRKKKLLTETDIKKHLRPILGNLVDDPAVLKVVSTIAFDPRVNNAKVVGVAELDGITLYGDAFTGVDYHEAFHRIFELFVPEQIRNKIYEKTAKDLGINLKESTRDNEYLGHRLVAEYLADKYMDHRRFNISTGWQTLDKIINWISDVVRVIAHWFGNKDMYKLFMDINSGVYANRKLISVKDADRFKTIFNRLNYEIHGTEFDHIANTPMYDQLLKTAFFCLLRGQNINVNGSNIQDIKVDPNTLEKGADTLKVFGFDIFGKDVEPTKKSAAQLAMTELLVKFDTIADDLAAMAAAISTDYRKIMLQDGREDADGGESQSSYDENFFKWSYEFDKFDKTSSRVKFFFATIPELEFKDESKSGYKYATNDLGLPQFMSMNYVFNEVLSNLWDIDTIEELMSRVARLALDDPMFAQIHSALRKVIDSRINKDGSVNADAEALFTQLINTIRSNRHTFMIMRAVSDPQGKYDLVIQRSDAEYNARVFPMQWSQVLAKGGSEVLKVDKNGTLVFNPKVEGAAKLFKDTATFFEQIKSAVSTENAGKGFIGLPVRYEYADSIGNVVPSSAYVKGSYVEDITKPEQCNILKDIIVDALNRIGINIHKEEFEYMLKHKYGSSDWEAIKLMMQSTDETDSISSFLFFLNNIERDGKLNLSDEGLFRNLYGKMVSFDNVFSDMAFVKELGNWKYEYRHAHDQLSILAVGGNRFYEMSDNDYMSDVLRDCNKRSKFFKDLKEDPYNYYTVSDNFGEDVLFGSVTIKQLTNNPDMKIQLKHFIGFKTDKKGDEGQDYFEISKREDYLSKMGILENDGMISLTLSDKKKYCYITGVKLPGINYEQIHKSSDPVTDMQLALQTVFVPDGVTSSTYTIQLREDVVDQMISYAMSEYKAILNAAERLEDGHRKVANFDTKEQGVRFSSLLGVWETIYDNEGRPNGEQYISFNNGKKSWIENLSIAEAYFFSRPIEEQRALMLRILSKRAEKEIKNAEKLGLIRRVSSDKNPFFGYTNVGLNNKTIQSLYLSYMEVHKKDSWFTSAMGESMAICAYINDISNKAIMSGQEMERLFSGNPAFYKWNYNKNGNLVDRTVDELKRLGGLGSTGINNFTLLEGIPEKYIKNGRFTGKYVVAEVDNEMVGSPLFEEVKQSMYEGTLRENIIQDRVMKETQRMNKLHEEEMLRLRNDDEVDQADINTAEVDFLESLDKMQSDITSLIDGMTIEELEKAYPESAKEARKDADEVSESLAKDIDVADGGAYISDQMCEMLLRMEGAYSKSIQEAFKILRGEIKADYLSQIDAYQKVLTSVIGNLKYTAFGRRLQDGKSVPYYHKMALFPIFDCIATGRMRNVFDKMKEQGIDMLLVNSAVKVGSEGSLNIDWNAYKQDDDKFNPKNYINEHVGQKQKPTFKDVFNFNTYECDFDYLRKQLNTDPKEEEMLRMGTQMQKVIFSNLVPGRTYTTQSGEQKTGKELLNRIMNSSKQLSNIGVDKMNKKFFKTNEAGQIVDINGKVLLDRNSNDRVLDIEKFSKEVRKLMSERGADANVMKALELVNTTNKEKKLAIPLGAISNANWLESVLISTINKDVVDVNTPGAFYIQRSIWGMEGSKMYDGKKSVKGQEDARKLYNGKRLQMVNEEGSMDCVLSIDFFAHILPKVWTGEYEVDEDGNYVYEKDLNGYYKLDKKYGKDYVPKKKMRDMTFIEAREWLLKKGIIGGKANIVAYRIPTQAESSIHALRCVDVIPVVRDTVILPQEFTKITGSDFDIDKLGLSTVNWNKSGSDTFEQDSEKYYQNLLIRDYITLLIDKRSQHILHRSIDNDTKLLKDVLAKIERNSSEEEMPYEFYSLTTLTERKDDYITGKIGIGPFALNNNSHILTMLYGVKFKDLPNSIMSTLGLTDLSVHKDKDGKSIMSWLSALINAHVDIAKDPYISRLNVNQFTYNLVNTLIRTGFGEDTFYFTTQPIMKELASAYNNAASSYMADQYKSKWQLQDEAVKSTAEDRFKDVKIGEWTFDELVEGVLNPKDVKYKPVINKYIKQLVDDNILERSANKDYYDTHGAVITVGDNKIELDRDQLQLLVYLAYLLFSPYATSVSNLVKYSKIDTKKHGKSWVEQLVYLKGFNNLFNNKDGSGLFERSGLTRLAKHSYIEPKTINAIYMTRNILKGQFLLATNGFTNAMQVMLNMIGKSNSLSVDLWNTISLAISASIKAEFFNEYMLDLQQYHNTYAHDLVSESEETLGYTQEAGSNRIKLTSKSKYDLKSYMGKPVYVTFDWNNQTWNYKYTIIGYDESTNEIIVNVPRRVANSGTIKLTEGENTIYDRFNRLAIELRDDPEYYDILDKSGEPANMLLRSLVPGREYDYSRLIYEPVGKEKELEETYTHLKFIKLFNAIDQNGVEANYIIDAWDQLLHDNKHPKLKQFAEDLVVYAFITSGDQGGFTKFFKQVPLSWRKESGYSLFIQDKLAELQTKDIDQDQLEDAILNNWFDNQLVPKYQLKDDKGKPNFMSWAGGRLSTNYVDSFLYPVLLAALRDENGILTPTIDPENSPLFIKIPRRNDKAAKNSQRRVTVYRRVSYGMRRDAAGNWVHYPIYVKVDQKGNQLKGNYLVTEYGRQDSLDKEYTISEEGLKKMYTLGDFMSRNEVQEYTRKYGNIFGQMIEDMNYQNLFETVFSRKETLLNDAIRENNKPVEEVEDQEQKQNALAALNIDLLDQSNYEMQSGGAPGADTVWGEIATEYGVTKQNHWYHGEKSEYNAPNANSLISDKDYEEGKSKVAKAAKMNWGYQYETMKDDRLVRNWALVKYADAVFAIGHIVGKGLKAFPNQSNDTRVAQTIMVTGGTGYAVGMAILENKPVYVFDQLLNRWALCINGTWSWLTEAPKLTPKFAGIGTRLINAAGRQAIKDVFEKTFGTIQTGNQKDEFRSKTNDAELSEEEQREAENYRKACKGE